MTDESRSIIILTQGAKLLAEARTLDDFRNLSALAQAAQHYARKAKLGKDAQNDAGVIAVEAMIREGEILQLAVEAKERDPGGHGPRVESESRTQLPTLADLGITRQESSDAQALAAHAPAVREALTASKAGKKPITVGRAARVARDAAAKARPTPIPSALPPDCDLRLGDFREVLADLPDGSVDVVLTDPPYPAEFLPLWGDLGAFARRVLKPGGLLVAMSGHIHLPEVMSLLGVHLPYRWTIAYLVPGAATVVHARRVNTMWKPVLVYGGTGRRLFDVVRSDAADKTYHAWGQSERGMAELLRLVADPGQLICDPFAGGGTTAVVALAAGCSFVGAENDPETHRVAVERIL